MCPTTHTILYYFVTHLYFCAEIGGRLLDGVSGSNPAGVMDICLFFSVLAGRLLVRRSPTECVSDCDIGTSIMRRSWPTGLYSHKKLVSGGRLQIMELLFMYFFLSSDELLFRRSTYFPHLFFLTL
jgi:hypothetical protein